MNLIEKTVKTQIQLELQDSILEKTKREFITARKAVASTNPVEREKAIELLDRARTTLILFFYFDLEDLAALADEGDAA